MHYEYRESGDGLERRAMQGRLIAGDWEPAGLDCAECGRDSLPAVWLLRWGRCDRCELNMV